MVGGGRERDYKIKKKEEENVFDRISISPAKTHPNKFFLEILIVLHFFFKKKKKRSAKTSLLAGKRCVVSVAPPNQPTKKTPPRFVIHPFTYFNSSCINKKAQFAPFLPAHTAYLINLVCAETFWYIKKNMLQNKKQKKRKKRGKKS